MSDLAFTCISCKLQFENLEEQREHYQSAYHCFNLHRGSAGLPPVSREIFEEKVQAVQHEQREAKNSKASKRAERREQRRGGGKKRGEKVPVASREPSVNLTVLANDLERAAREREDPEAAAADPEAAAAEPALTEEEMERVLEERVATAIANNVCLFDDHASETPEANAEYMKERFSLYLPDQTYLVDLAGLLEYLGAKVGVGHLCLFCDRAFSSVADVRRHMADAGHRMIRFAGAEDDLAPFYSWGADSDDDEPSSSTAVVAVERTDSIVISDNGLELVLPDGRTIGHRAMRRYYRQKYVRLHRKEPYAPTKPNTDLRSIDIRRQHGEAMRLSVKANKLQHHFRPQVDV